MRPFIRFRSSILLKGQEICVLTRIKTFLQTVCVILFLAGCEQMYTEKRPQLYPNEKLSRTSSSQAQADIDRCMALADSYVKEPDRYADIARQGLIGGIVGAGTGTVAGTIMGEAGEGTGAGAAVGGILGVLKGLSEVNERTPSYERFVEHCLQRQGYEVLY